MTYEEAMTSQEISRNEAIAEIENHGASLPDFFEDCGDKEIYDSRAVMAWLGY